MQVMLRVTVVVRKFIHHQVDIYLKITCAQSHRVVINTAPDTVMSVKVHYYPFTLILVYLVMLMGVWYRGVETVCGILSLRHFTFQTYVRYSQYVIRKSVEHAKDVLQNSRR